MNTLSGHIASIKSSGSLSIVMVKVGQEYLKTVVLEKQYGEPLLKEGMPINFIFKETEVVIGTGNTDNISLQNKLRGKVRKMEKGKLLCKLTISTSIGDIVSIITSAAIEQLKIDIGSEITAMIKTNEIMLSA